MAVLEDLALPGEVEHAPGREGDRHWGSCGVPALMINDKVMTMGRRHERCSSNWLAEADQHKNNQGETDGQFKN